MDWLPKDLQEILEFTTRQTEQMVDGVVELCGQAVEDVEKSLDSLDILLEPAVVEVERTLDSLLDPIVVDLLGFEQTIEELASPLTQRIYPLLDQQPACAGCRFYHGKTYGDHLLVCGMHPYGTQGQSCPDWESC